MKIAFVVPSLANKGPVIVVKNLVDYFVSRNIYCEVFYFTDIKELNFSCKTTEIKKFDFNAVDEFDIMHTHGIRPDMYGFLNLNCRIKRISTIHSYIRKDFETSMGYSKLKSKFFEVIWNIFLIRTDKIIVLSKDAKKYYDNILSNKKIDYIYNGLTFSGKNNDIKEKDLLESFKNNGFKLIGANALLTYRKGLHQIIKALPYFKNLIFIIVGDGPEKLKLQELSKELYVEDRCLFLGYKSNSLDYLNIYDYFAIPSYSEGFPLALIEASAYKKPTIASDIPIHKEAFNEHEVAFAILDDEKSMHDAIRNLMENSESLSSNIYKKYLNNYTLEKMGQKYYEVYKNLLGGI